MSTFLNYTYSFVATRASDYWIASCGLPTGPGGVTIITQSSFGLYRSSLNGASCSNYTFIATSNNTRVAIDQCFVAAPTSSGPPSSFTHSLIYNTGDVGFVCSATAPQLESGSWVDNNTHIQPKSPCDCGRNYLTTTTTTTTTTIAPFTQSWRALRLCGCDDIHFTSTISNINIAQFSPSPNRVYRGPDNNCYRLINTVSFSQSIYPTFNSGFSIDCLDCERSLPPGNVCVTTTTTSTTTVIAQCPSTLANCNCAPFCCKAYEVQGNPDDSIRWTECSQSIQNGGHTNFGFYYFYDTENISFCACSNSVQVISGNPVINGNSISVGQVPTPGLDCIQDTSNCTVCQSFAVELGTELTNFSDRPLLVEYKSCYAPTGGWQNPFNYPHRTMWPLLINQSINFTGLPIPPPVWSPVPTNGGTVFGRKTNLFSICACGKGLTSGDPTFTSPTISYYSGGWQQASLTLDESTIEGGLDYYIRTGFGGSTCSCYNYPTPTTTTTTLIPCPNCRPTVIGASGSDFTSIVYEGCDTLVKHNIETEYLFRGVTTSICACERCRSVRVRPLGAAGTFTPLNYVHCCDPVFGAANSQSGYQPPSYHSSVLNLQVRTCRNFTLGCGFAPSCRFRFVGCTDSKIYEIDVPDVPGTLNICAATVSAISNIQYTSITNGNSCGTASAEICISRDYYGATVFPDDPTLGSVGLGIFTFSNIGSCSCITSDNRYQPYTSRGFNVPLSSAPDPLIEFLTITFSTATCSDKTLSVLNLSSAVLPNQPSCCDCNIYQISNLSVNDVVTYRPCDANYTPDTFVSLSLPRIDMNFTTQSTGSFSVRVTAAGFYNVGSFSIVFNHDKLVFYTASVLQSSLSSGGNFANSGSFSRFAWSGTPGNFGGGDILNFTFAAISSALMEFVTSSVATFYQSTNVSNPSGQKINVSIGDGYIKFPGIPLPSSNKGSTPPTFPSFP